MNTVIIFNPYSAWPYHFTYEVAIFHNLKHAGYAPLYVRCGMQQVTCDLYWGVDKADRPKDACGKCNLFTSNALERNLIDYVSISDHIDVGNYSELSCKIDHSTPNELRLIKVRGVNLYDVSLSSVFTHFRINSFDINIDSQRDVLKTYMKISGGTVLAADNLVSKFQPVSALVFNGRVAPTRAFIEVCRQNDIRFVTHERGWSAGALYFVAGGDCLSLAPYKEVASFAKNYVLKPAQTRVVKKWIEFRRKGKNLNWRPFSIENESQPSFFSSAIKTRWVLFTSSMDEMLSSPEYWSPFGNQEKWIEHTVSFALDNSHLIELIIRVHPNSSSDVSTGHNKQEKIYFESLYKRVRETNVKLIFSHQKVSSYAVLNEADQVFCYGSTLALEAIVSGKSVYVAASSPWILCPGIDTFESTPNYDHYLSSRAHKKNCVVKPEGLRGAFRFAYIFLRHYQLNFPIESLNFLQNRLNILDYQELLPGFNPDLDRARAVLVGGRSVIQAPNAVVHKNDLEKEIKAIFDLTLQGSDCFLSLIIFHDSSTPQSLVSCVRSAILNRLESYEVLVIVQQNDSNFEYFLEEFSSPAFSRVRTVRAQVGDTEFSLVRHGISIARGSYISLLYSHCVLAPNFVDRICRLIEDRPEINIISTNTLLKRGNLSDRKRALAMSEKLISTELAQQSCVVFEKNFWEESVSRAAKPDVSLQFFAASLADIYRYLSSNSPAVVYSNDIGCVYFD